MILVFIRENRNDKVRLIKWRCPFIFVKRISSEDLIVNLNVDPRCDFKLTKDKVFVSINKDKLKYGNYYLTFYHYPEDGPNIFLKEQIGKFPRLFEYPLSKGARVCIDNVNGKLREAYIPNDEEPIKLRWIECNCDPLETHICETNSWLILNNWINLTKKRNIIYKEEENICSLTVINENKEIYVCSKMEDNIGDTNEYKLKLASQILIDLGINEKL